MCILICLTTGCDEMNPELVESTVAKGNVIVIALNKYYADNNCFPGELEDLIPKYLESNEALYVNGENFYYASAENTDSHPYGFDLLFVLGPRGMLGFLDTKTRLFLRYDPDRIFPDGPRGKIIQKIEEGWIIRKEMR